MLALRHSGIDLDSVIGEVTNERKTKIICTIGPSCWSREMLGKMLQAGMNVARLNFSHGDHEVHANTVANLRAALADNPEKACAILLDTKGPEIRTGFLSTEDKKVVLKAGQDLELTTDYEHLGDSTKIACSYKALPTSVKVGQKILAADGSLIMTVKELKTESIIVTVMNNAIVGERKNMNLPGVIVDLPTITEKDRNDLVNFGLVHGVDFIAASFLRKASDVHYIREVLGPRGANIKIFPKIENQEGLENFDAILEAADGIMVARGDLGMEIPPEKVFLAQKMMIRKANVAGKPIITATQMLESMIQNPRPTRAECTDVANAVLDGTDCVMLSGETAGGAFPLEAVTIMGAVCREAEASLNYNKLYQAIRNTTMAENDKVDITETIASSAVKAAIDCGAKMLVVCTESGRSARLVAKYRPGIPLLVLTASPEAARYVNGCIKGATAIAMGSMVGTDIILVRGADLGKELGYCKSGDLLVAVHGVLEAKSGATNMLKILPVQ
eukprot:TRINITY_DN339_c0_g1_i1.p1 TRINITY_DN339_c0_g1~~TRINITY_DN339_c0_g1_i1.p1  ORF type:complete len:503 (-),score=195.87 TRINITY_DN339_c0_g1_i1:171-1679(-)